MNWQEGGTQGFTPEDALKEERDYLEANKSLLWHPITEIPTEEGIYLVQHFYRDWNGNEHTTFDTNHLEELKDDIEWSKKYGNRDIHYVAWMKIEPYKEAENDNK